MHDATSAAIEQGLDLFGRMILENLPLRAEFEGTRALFGQRDGSGNDAQADRRHLEWFCLERASDTLEGVPVEALKESWFQRADRLEEDGYASLLESRASAFEISDVDPRKGLWVQDVFGRGEFPVHEPDAQAALDVGDLLVGRIFPAEDGVFRLSPAMWCFRDATLRDALKADAERLREGRRGTLRIEQVELERLFFPHETSASTELEQRELLTALDEAGLATSEIDRVVGEFRLARKEGVEGGEIVTETLNRLAFETEVDLEDVRRPLISLWSLLGRSVSKERSKAEPEPESNAPRADSKVTRRAVEAFVEATDGGTDLEERFRELEQQLGFSEAPGEEADGGDPVPDFPGVVGAMVEEFLWDHERQNGPDRQGLHRLRELSDYAGAIGVFENLSARDLLDFTGRWLLDEGPRAWTPAEALELVDAVAVFSRWTEEHHCHPLWSSLEPHFARLRADIPRLREARSWLSWRPSKSAELYRITSTGDAWAELEDPRGDRSTLEIAPQLSAKLEAGDLILAEESPAGRLEVLGAYPGALGQVLEGEEGSGDALTSER